MKKSGFLFLFICSALLQFVIAQTPIGLPAIKNYKHDDFKAGTEIWDIKQDNNGNLYFANNDGLLTFNGNYWKTYTMPNKSTIKSILIDGCGRIFAGGQDEIGYFFPDSAGILKFHSIKNLLPKKAQQFADIWDIVAFNKEIFFRTVECIFEYNGRELKTFDAPSGWRLLSAAGKQLFADDKDSGLLSFKDGRWQHCCDSVQAAALHITGITTYKGDTVLVSTQRKGLFLLNNSVFSKKPTATDLLLSNDLVNNITGIGKNRYALATTANGLLIIDGKGQLIEHFSGSNGLQNNNVHSLLIDKDKDLWLGMENGLDFINYNTSVKYIYPGGANQSKGNAVCVFNNKLFIGTSNGLYSLPIDGGKRDLSTCTSLFTEINNTKGHVWSLGEINNNLVIGHQDGILVLQNNRPVSVSSRQGAWTFKVLPSTNKVIAGTYTGLQLVSFDKNVFKDEVKIDGIYESLSTLAIDNEGIVWASHRYRGIYKIELTADKKSIARYRQFTEKDGLPSKLNNHVYFIKNKVLAATEKGIYEYNSATNKFKPSAFYHAIFGDADVEYLTGDASGNLWFISNQHAGVVDFSRSSVKAPYHVVYFPELTGQMQNGFEYIYPYNSENIFMGADNGIIHLNYKEYVASQNSLNASITAVKAIAEKDSLIFGGYFTKNSRTSTEQDLGQITTLDNHWNSFHFEFSSTSYTGRGNVEYSYKLRGFDGSWSPWSAKTEKDYTNLPYGWYTFAVRARNNLGKVSQPARYTFIVKPAPYQTVWAYLFYLAVAGFVVYYIRYVQQRRLDIYRQKHEEEQQRLSYLHSLELDRSEKEIIALKNENLESELNYKNKELATITMHLVDRGKLLLTIKDELNTLTKKLNIPDSSYHFRSVFKLLNDTEKNGDDWDQFSMYFDQVHNNFLSVLKAKFPGLSATDLKLCAYLRLNLTSKEIAQLLNISLKGVEISRYRVRKKLNLSTDVNLYDFLIETTR